MQEVRLNISTTLMLRIVFVAALFLGFWELRGTIISILVLLFLAFIINAGIRPLVNRLEKRDVPRGVAVGVIYVSLIIGVSLVFFVIASQFGEQVVNLIQSLPEIFSRSVEFIQTNIPVLANLLPLDQLSTELGQSIDAFINSQAFRDFASGENAFSLLRQTFGLFSSVAELLISTLTVMMISIYMVARKEPVYSGILDIMPKKFSKIFAPFFRKVEVSLGSWLGGQLIAMLSIGVATYFLIVIPALFIPGYQLASYAIPIALMAGLLEALPSIGPLITFIVTVILALGTSGVGVVIYIAIAFIALQQIEGIWLIPMVMKKAIGIDPILSILGIITGFQLGGIVGALIAIPIIGILLIVIQQLVEEYRKYEKNNPKLIEE